MRLNFKEIKAIKDVGKAVFGETASIWLFGSRTDDHMKGGDIDLLIQCNTPISQIDQYQRKINFLVQLKKIIGDQKIDVIIDRGQLDNFFMQEVYKKRVLL